jgi:hypothetical protein
MEVNSISIPSLASIRVSKEGKSAVFETTIIQTTDNKYIYALPVRVDGKLVNFETKGIIKEIMVEIAPNEFYQWKNISIIKFAEKGKRFLRIKTTTPGTRAVKWKEKTLTTLKQRTPLVILNEPEEEPMPEGGAVAEG